MREDQVDQLVLTRFNVAFEGSGDLGIRDDWLAARLSLFETVCAPSMRAQHGRQRSWLIFVDARTPDAARRRITAAGAPGQVRLVEVDGNLPDDRLQRLVGQAVPARRPYLITTRLDNDDALSVDHLDVMRMAARPAEAEFLNPLHGYQLTPRGLYATVDPSSPFLTLVERRSAQPPRTAFCVPHRRARDMHPVRQVRGSSLWVQSVHGANLANTVTGVRVDSGRLRTGFPHLCADGNCRDVHDLAFRRDQLRSLGRAALTRGRRGLLHGWERSRAFIRGVR